MCNIKIIFLGFVPGQFASIKYSWVLKTNFWLLGLLLFWDYGFSNVDVTLIIQDTVHRCYLWTHLSVGRRISHRSENVVGYPRSLHHPRPSWNDRRHRKWLLQIAFKVSTVFVGPILKLSAPFAVVLCIPEDSGDPHQNLQNGTHGFFGWRSEASRGHFRALHASCRCHFEGFHLHSKVCFHLKISTANWLAPLVRGNPNPLDPIGPMIPCLWIHYLLVFPGT